VNARDALLTPLYGHAGTGGVLEVGVDHVTLERSTVRAWADLQPGTYVRLRVRDTGHGMEAAIRARAFEPFFTTKEVGRGTGLGLATVFGIVRQAGGSVRLDSTPGRGTAVTILLPAADGSPSADAAPRDERRTSASPATVLLVEDELAVRTVTRRVLERHGYTVLEARHGADALLVWEEHGARIDVLVTDVRMPELGGPELVARLRRLAPALPVVYVTGYAEEGGVDMRRADEAYVEKPFTADELLAALRRVREARSP
jgi:CheY-like chemotaxis protein